jgi:hypothetical protein
MAEGMRSVDPDAEFISWLYTPKNGSGRQLESVDAFAAHVPEDVVLMYNFESGGGKEQLGRMRGDTGWTGTVEAGENRYRAVIVLPLDSFQGDMVPGRTARVNVLRTWTLAESPHLLHANAWAEPVYGPPRLGYGAERPAGLGTLRIRPGD